MKRLSDNMASNMEANYVLSLRVIVNAKEGREGKKKLALLVVTRTITG